MYVTRQPSDLGDLLVVSTHEGHILRIVDAGATVVADIGAHHPSGINDMLVDERGRAYVCTRPCRRPADRRTLGAAVPRVA
jgi:sugar lactone lactonase YvrE